MHGQREPVRRSISGQCPQMVLRIRTAIHVTYFGTRRVVLAKDGGSAVDARDSATLKQMRWSVQWSQFEQPRNSLWIGYPECVLRRLI